MDHHERDRERGRSSRASSTSSLGREVRCACQFFQSDSLLPERRAMVASRPSSRNTNPPPIISARSASEDDAGREHEYEPIGTPLVNPRTMTPVTPAAPVVRIIDTDVVPVADSDDSIDLDGRFTPGPVLEGNELILPLDGKIEDNAMETRELVGGGDTSEELESPQQLQDRIEERFFNAATPCTESRTDGEVNTSQVDSSAIEELPLRRGARGLPQRLRSQAGKLRSRIKSIQKPNFSLSIDRIRAERAKSRGSSERSKSASEKKSSTSERTKVSSESRSGRSGEKRTRMERLRSSLPDRPRISFPDRPKFNFPDRSKFHLPERPRFNIKKPTVRFPTLGKRRGASLGEIQRPRSDESSAGSRRNIFDFSTYPRRLFDRKSKSQREYETSSPKESRAQSIESASTLPRAKKPSASLGPKWSAKFTDLKFADDEDEEEEVSPTLAERSKPWRHPSLEEPRPSLRPQESLEQTESLPWEDSEEAPNDRRLERVSYEEDRQDYEPEERIERTKIRGLGRTTSEESYEDEPPRIDPRLYGDQEVEEAEDREAYRAAFMPLDPRFYERGKLHRRDTESADEEEPISSGLEEDRSARSDREQQQSSGSSCDRRRRGIIEEIDSDEFIIGRQDANVARFLTTEIREALRKPENVLAHEILMVGPPSESPPRRPARRSLRKSTERSVESYEIIAPARPKRDNRRISLEAEYEYEREMFVDNLEENLSGSHHRIVYHAESAPVDLARIEPLDDIVVVKPIRRKSRSSMRSESLRRSDSLVPEGPPPAAPPRRRKRPRGEDPMESRFDSSPRVNGVPAIPNGHASPDRIERIPPKKPERTSSRETVGSRASSRLEPENVDFPPPVPPKRSSRSRGASLIRDDDGTSHGAESIPEMEFEEEEPLPRDYDDDEEDSRLEYPGYAMIEKREKPPRPPPPRKRRNEKFATTPRPGKTPSRPQRAYSTLRPARSKTPLEARPVEAPESVDVAYEELNSDDEIERHLRSGIVVEKIQGRPLPAPPRPPRARRERSIEEVEDVPRVREGTPMIMREAFASTQTDPLPDDMLIEEEITQAKLVVAPSRSGSQILVSMERIPSPTVSKSPERPRVEPSVPTVPPLPSHRSLYSDDVQDDLESLGRHKSRSESPGLREEFARKRDEYEAEMEARLQSSLSERMRLEEELEQARSLRSALMASEPLKIASLEVSDLRVDHLNVTNLEAQKLTASEIEALVVTASEITNKSETSDESSNLQPTMLRELVAIRSQLELVSSTQRTLAESTIAREPTRRDENVRLREITYPSSQPMHLQPEKTSRATESRASLSSIERSRESSPQPGDTSETVVKDEKFEIRAESRSRSSSPGRTVTPPLRLRQTASPVRSLPPAISVTPDTPDVVQSPAEQTEPRLPQRATISFIREEECPSESLAEAPSFPRNVPPTIPSGNTQFIAFPTSQIPPEFFSLASPAPGTASRSVEEEPGVVDLGQQLARALRLACKRAMRHFVAYIVNRVGQEETDTKMREIELALCALLLIIAGLLIACFGGPRTITHHHHWDYFNPPRL